MEKNDKNSNEKEQSVKSIYNIMPLSTDLYLINFSTSQNKCAWKVKSGTGTITIANGVFNIKTTVSNIVDDNSPMIANGIYTAFFKYTSNDSNEGRIGFIFRYVDSNNWTAICYDIGKWVWKNSSTYESFVSNLPNLQANKQYTMTIQYNNSQVIATFSGEALTNGDITTTANIPQLQIVSGKVGISSWYVDKNIDLDYIFLQDNS